jgi:hypothetical protein
LKLAAAVVLGPTLAAPSQETLPVLAVRGLLSNLVFYHGR